MVQTQLTEFDHDDKQEEDWIFVCADTNYMTHGLHPYPVRMVPQIARRLILRYSAEDELVWDPFCGSGTSLVESMLLGRRSIGTDINPFAIFLSRVKTTPLNVHKLKEIFRKINSRLTEYNNVVQNVKISPLLLCCTNEPGSSQDEARHTHLCIADRSTSLSGCPE